MPSSCPRSDAASSLDFRVEVIEIILISIYIHTYIKDIRLCYVPQLVSGNTPWRNLSCLLGSRLHELIRLRTPLKALKCKIHAYIHTCIQLSLGLRVIGTGSRV